MVSYNRGYWFTDISHLTRLNRKKNYKFTVDAMEPNSLLELSNTVLKLNWKLYRFFKAIGHAPKEAHDYLGILETIRCLLQDVKEYSEEHWRSSFFEYDEIRFCYMALAKSNRG